MEKPPTNAEMDLLTSFAGRNVLGMADVRRLREHLASENAKLREAALTVAATAVLLLRDRALLLPAESEKWEAACGKLNRVLEAP